MGLACCTVAVGQDPQPGWQWVEAAVEYDYARSCSFTDGGIAHVGSNGLCLRQGTADILIQGNEVCDTGGGGLGAGYMENAAYGYVHAPSPEPGECRGYRIANNYVHHCGLEDYGAFGIEVSEVQDTVIAHNLIHDTAYFGMCVAGSQARRETPFARNNTVEHNHVHDAMQVTVDGAGLYVTFARKLWVGVEWDGRVLSAVQPLPNVGPVLGEGGARQTGRQLTEEGLLVRLAQGPQVAWIAYQRAKTP